MSNTKKIEEVTKGIEFKLVFFSKFANNCLMTKDVNNCKEETTRELSKMVDNVRNEIERIWLFIGWIFMLENIDFGELWWYLK